MADDLRILITASLDQTESTKQINSVIKEIEKNIESLNLNINVPDVSKTMQDFIDATEKMRSVTQSHNDVIREEIREFESLDGTIKKVITSHTRSGEVKTRIIEKHKEAEAAIEKEKRSLKELLSEYDNFNKLKSVQTRYDDQGQEVGSTRVYSDGNRLLKATLDAQGKLLNYTITDRIETEKLIKKKIELREKLQELAQVGNVSSSQLAKVAREVNTAFDDDGIQRATKALQNAQNISKERLRIIQTQHKITSDQAKQMAKWEKDVDRAHYLAYKEKEKRESHLHKLVLDRVEAEKKAYEEHAKRQKSPAALRLDGATRVGEFEQLRKPDISHEDIAKVLALSNAYKNMEIRGVKLNQVTGQWTATLRKSATENLNLKGVVDRTNGSLYEQERAVTQVAAKNLGVFQQLRIAMERVPVWMGAMTAFYAPIRGMRLATQQLLEIDKQMTALMRVSNGEIDRIEILKESIDLADRLGNRIIDINEGIENFARQGFRGQGLIAMTEAATLFSNISDMDVEKASSGLTAIIKGFQMLPEEVMRSVDAINEVDNNFAVSSQQIVQSMQKSVGAAQTFGVELEELIGMTVAIGETTRESGDIIGNSLKTIFSRITTMDSSIDALRSVGVSVKEIRDGVEIVRPVSDILEDLAAKWSRLSAEQQQNIGLQIAGRFQLSRFLVLMQNYQTALDATATALNSQGSAYRENEAYLQSLDARINRMKNAGTELALALGDAFLTDSIIVFTESVTELTRFISDLVEVTGVMPIAFGAAGLGAAMLSKNFRTTTISVLTLGNGLKSLGVSANTAKVALRGLAASSVIGLGFVALGAILEGVIGSMARLTQDFEETTKKAIESSEAINKQADTIDSLIDRYEELKPKADGNAKAQAELKDVMDELHKIAPMLTKELILQKDVLELNTEKAREYAEQLRKLSEEEKEALRIVLASRYDSTIDEIDKLSNSIDEVKEKIKEAQSAIDDYHEEFGVSTERDFHEVLSRLRNESEITYEEYERIINDYNSLRNQIDRSGYTELLDERASKEKTLAFIQEQLTALSEEQKEAIDGLANSTSNLANQTSRSIPYFDQEGKLLGSVADEAELLAKGYKILYREMGELEDGTPNLVSYVVGLTVSIEDQIKKANELSSSIGFLADVYETLQEGKELSLDTTIRLISEYPELINHLNDHNSLIRDEGSLINWVANLRREAFIEEQRMELESVDATYAALEAKRNMYRDFYMRMAGQMPQEQLELQAKNYFSKEDQELYRQLSADRKRIQGLIDAFSDPINIGDIVVSRSRRGTSSANELNPFIPDEYARALEEVNVQLAIIESKKARVSQESEEYAILLRQEIELYKLQQNLAHQEANRLRDVNKELEVKRSNLSQTSQEYHDLSREIYNNESTILSLQQTWRGLERQIINTNKAIEDLDFSRIEELRKEQEKWADSVRSSAKDAMGVIEDYYKEQERLAKESLDNQLKEFNDFIDTQLRLLDRLEDTEDYNKELSKKQQERAKIESRINELILDDSYKAQAERRELEEELAKIIEDIDDFQLDRQRKLRRDNFQDLKDTKRRQIDEEKRAVETTWKNALETDQYYLSLRENLLNNNIANLQNTLQSFAKNVEGYMIHVGDSIQKNTIDKVIAAQREIERINNLQSNIRSSNVSGEQQVIYQMMANSSQWQEASQSRRQELHAANQQLAKQIGAVYNAAEGRWYKNGIPLYHSGGEIGNRTPIGSLLDKILNKGEVPIIAKQGEVVLRDPMLAFQNMAKAMSLSHLKDKNSDNVQYIYQIDMHIENLNGDKKSADLVFNRIESRLKRLGKK